MTPFTNPHKIETSTSRMGISNSEKLQCAYVENRYPRGTKAELTPERENNVNSDNILSQGIEGNTEYCNLIINTVTLFVIKNTSPQSNLYLTGLTNSKGTDLQRPKNRE